jgi:hypothetical protein
VNTLVSRSFKTVDVTRLASFTEVRCRRIGSPVLRNYVTAIISTFVVKNYRSFISCVRAFHCEAFSKLAYALPDRTFYVLRILGSWCLNYPDWFVRQSRKSPQFMESEDSLPCSLGTATASCPEQDQSSPCSAFCVNILLFHLRLDLYLIFIMKVNTALWTLHWFILQLVSAVSFGHNRVESLT